MPVMTSFTSVCAPKPMARPDDAGAGQQRRDVDAELRQHDQRHHHEQHDSEGVAQQGQHRADAGAARGVMPLGSGGAGDSVPRSSLAISDRNRATRRMMPIVTRLPNTRRPKSLVSHANACRPQASSSRSAAKK